MSANEPFIDTNVLLYLLSDDPRKADRAESLIEAGGIISVQVLNEFASVALRKLSLPISQVKELLATLRALCRVIPLTEAIHDRGIDLCARHRLSLYDAMIVSAALDAQSRTLYSEDMQHGRVFQRTLRIVNPLR